MIAANNQTTNNCKTIEWSKFTTRPALKAIMIGFVLIILNVNNGVITIMTYITYLFKDIGSNLTPNEAGIIASATQLVGVFIATQLVDRQLGRRVRNIYSVFFALVHLNEIQIFTILSDFDYNIRHWFHFMFIVIWRQQLDVEVRAF